MREWDGKSRMCDTKRSGSYERKKSSLRCVRLTMKSMYLAL